MVPRGGLPLLGELPDSWNPRPMNIENYRAGTLALSARLPFAFGWLVGDAEWAMGIIGCAHSQEWGDLPRRSGGLRPGDAIERLMAAWMTGRQIPVPRWLRPAIQRAHQPYVPPPQPDTYRNAAQAQAAHDVVAPAWFSPDTPSRPGESDPSKIPYQYRCPSSSSASIRI